MIKVTVEAVLLFVLLGFAILIAMSIMLGAVFPWLIIAGIGAAIYHHLHKKKQDKVVLCPDCELKQLEKGYTCQHNIQ